MTSRQITGRMVMIVKHIVCGLTSSLPLIHSMHLQSSTPGFTHHPDHLYQHPSCCVNESRVHGVSVPLCTRWGTDASPIFTRHGLRHISSPRNNVDTTIEQHWMMEQHNIPLTFCLSLAVLMLLQVPCKLYWFHRFLTKEISSIA